MGKIKEWFNKFFSDDGKTLTEEKQTEEEEFDTCPTCDGDLEKFGEFERCRKCETFCESCGEEIEETAQSCPGCKEVFED